MAYPVFILAVLVVILGSEVDRLRQERDALIADPVHDGLLAAIATCKEEEE